MRQNPLSQLKAYLSRPDVRQALLRHGSRRVRFEVERRVHPSGLWRERVIVFDRDLRICVRIAENVGRSIYIYGVSEFRVARLFTRLVQPGMVVFDVGAHIGQYTLLAAKRVGQSGRVVAVEPNPDNVRVLEMNVLRNRFANVEIIKAALFDYDGEAILHVPNGPNRSELGSLLPVGDRRESFSVKAVRLDSIAPTRLDILKLDAEGAEANVIRGAAETLRRCRPAIIFEVFANRPPTVIDSIRRLGFGIFGISPSGTLEEVSAASDIGSYREPWCALNLVAMSPEVPVGVRDPALGRGNQIP